MVGKKRLRLEIKEEMILRLLKAGHVCAADLYCLDCESKQCIWRLCIGSCACKMNEPERLCRAKRQARWCNKLKVCFTKKRLTKKMHHVIKDL